jgi:hypothetical protein
MRVTSRSVALTALVATLSVAGCQCGLEPLAAQPGSLAGIACDPECDVYLTADAETVDQAPSATRRRSSASTTATVA